MQNWRLWFPTAPVSHSQQPLLFTRPLLRLLRRVLKGKFSYKKGLHAITGTLLKVKLLFCFLCSHGCVMHVAGCEALETMVRGQGIPKVWSKIAFTPYPFLFAKPEPNQPQSSIKVSQMALKLNRYLSHTPVLTQIHNCPSSPNHVKPSAWNYLSFPTQKTALIIWSLFDPQDTLLQVRNMRNSKPLQVNKRITKFKDKSSANQRNTHSIG